MKKNVVEYGGTLEIHFKVGPMSVEHNPLQKQAYLRSIRMGMISILSHDPKIRHITLHWVYGIYGISTSQMLRANLNI